MGEMVTVYTGTETFTYEQCDEDPWCIFSPHPGDPTHGDNTGYTWENTAEDLVRFLYNNNGKPIGKVVC